VKIRPRLGRTATHRATGASARTTSFVMCSQSSTTSTVVPSVLRVGTIQACMLVKINVLTNRFRNDCPARHNVRVAAARVDTDCRQQGGPKPLARREGPRLHGPNRCGARGNLSVTDKDDDEAGPS
jgi:hypothetical protein